MNAARGQRPRLGFLGVGWIGRDRMLAVQRSGVAEVAAVADVSVEAADGAACETGAPVLAVEQLLRGEGGLDGVVIATPSALHAEQALAALDAGLAVCCQKPLGRTAAECEQIVAAARAADRLLGVDLSYRHLAAVLPLRGLLRDGAIGNVYATDLVFHNAYGPDKPWFTDRRLSGGGCVIDLGIHLVDLAWWLLDRPKASAVTSRLFAGGRPLAIGSAAVEDFATARIDLADGSCVELACSWFLPAGRDAVIEATFYGTEGSLSLQNVGGSFYDFRSELRRGNSTEVLADAPDAWGGRAVVAWAERLAVDPSFDPEVEELVAVADVLDRVAAG